MANALPLLVLAGGAALLLGKKKKKTSPVARQPSTTVEVPPTQPPAVVTKGPSGGTASTQTWRSRQEALTFVATMTGCDSNPGSIDGKYGSKTRAAVRGFQACAGIGVDGRWGSRTESAMKKMLAEIGAGKVSVSADCPSSITFDINKVKTYSVKWVDKETGTEMEVNTFEIILDAAEAGDRNIISLTTKVLASQIPTRCMSNPNVVVRFGKRTFNAPSFFYLIAMSVAADLRQISEFTWEEGTLAQAALVAWWNKTMPGKPLPSA